MCPAKGDGVTILLLREPATESEVAHMLEAHQSYIKVEHVVRKLLQRT
jgi:hypothetical protein